MATPVKPKDVPRYDIILKYEGGFKKSYANGLVNSMKEVVKEANKMSKEPNK